MDPQLELAEVNEGVQIVHESPGHESPGESPGLYNGSLNSSFLFFNNNFTSFFFWPASAAQATLTPKRPLRTPRTCGGMQ